MITAFRIAILALWALRYRPVNLHRTAVVVESLPAGCGRRAGMVEA